ncbi:MAG: hypothetical protein AB2800_09720 [Candidatus Thiodiazotropha endolucinida]
MPILHIQTKFEIPMVGTWKWQDKDYQIPLRFPLDGATAYLYFDKSNSGKLDRHILWEGKLLIKITSPTKKLLRSINSNSTASEEAADKIYRYYEEVFDKFEAIARSVGKMKNLTVSEKVSKKSFYEDGPLSTDKITWWIENNKPKIFTPTLKKGRRRLNPLFNKEQIITKAKWKNMQEAIDAHDYPSEELLELLRIRSKLEWRQKKIATIESAILVETMLRAYGRQVLLTLGISRTKLKSLKDDMSFNTVLNIVLPLSLTKTELKKVDKHLKSVDLLRKIRNDVVHGNIEDDEIDENNVRTGIEGALVLVDLLQKKIK